MYSSKGSVSFNTELQSNIILKFMLLRHFPTESIPWQQVHLKATSIVEGFLKKMRQKCTQYKFITSMPVIIYHCFLEQC